MPRQQQPSPAPIDKVNCRQIGDRWYVTYGGLIRNHYASGRVAFQNTFEIVDQLVAGQVKPPASRLDGARLS